MRLGYETETVNSPKGCIFTLRNTQGCAINQSIPQRSRRWSALGTPLQQQGRSRCVSPVGRPTFALTVCAKKRRTRMFSLVVSPTTDHSGGTVSPEKGTKTCLRNPGSSQQLHHSPSLAASKLTCSAAPLAQPLVQSLQTHSAQTQPQQPLPVLPLACCVTTPASAAPHAKTPSARSPRTSLIDRRRGSAPAAILRSKDPIHV